MFLRYLLACAVCAGTLGCDLTEKTGSATDLQMVADTVTRTVDSLAIRESGPGALVAEPPIADTAGKIPSASLTDLSVSGTIDTASGPRPRAIPAEPPPRTGGASTIRHLP